MPFELDPAPPQKVPIAQPIDAPPEPPVESVDDLKVKLAAETSQREQAQRDAAEQRDRYTNLALATLNSNQNTPTPNAAPAAPPMPDKDEEPEAYQTAVIQKQIADGITQAVTPLYRQFQQHASTNHANTLAQQKLQFRGDPDFPGYAEVEEDVDKFLSSFPIEQQVMPGARAEAYWRLMGKEMVAEKVKNTIRENSQVGSPRTSSSRQAPSTGPGDVQPMDDRSRFFAQRSGMGSEEFSAYRGRGTMTIDDFRSAQTEEEGRHKKGAA